MKSTFFTLAAFAAATQALDLGLGVDADVQLGNLLGVKIHLPLGLDLPLGEHPSGPPGEGCTDVYHPPHHGVDMDGCDNDSDNGWHWVHPGQGHHTTQPPYAWTTSTVTSSSVSTIISCEATVTNCPAHSTILTTVVVPATTTICPVEVSSAPSSIYYPLPTTTAPATAPATATATVPAPVISMTTQPPYVPVETPGYTAPVAPVTSVETPVYTAPAGTPSYVAPPPVYTPGPVAPTTAPPAVYVPTTMAPQVAPPVSPSMPQGNATYSAPTNYTTPPAYTAGAAHVKTVGLAAAAGVVVAALM